MPNVLDHISRRLTASSDSPRLDATLLIQHATGWSRTALLAHPERQPSYEQMEVLEQLVARREQHEPVAYLVGQREFYGRAFRTDSRALVPRPETEMLVEIGLRAVAGWRAAAVEPRVVEVGTGTGAIAVSLAAETDCRVVATELSEEALSLARENVDLLGQTERVELVRTDLIAGIAGPIQLVLANLPYIPSERKLPLTVARFEPHAALFSGSTGMDLNRRLLHEAVKLMAAGGEIALEMDEGQGTDLSALAFRLYSGATVEVLRDAAGLERVVHVRLAD